MVEQKKQMFFEKKIQEKTTYIKIQMLKEKLKKIYFLGHRIWTPAIVRIKINVSACLIFFLINKIKKNHN